MVNTRFWSDEFIVELNPLDRYFFLYLLTNEHTTISGLYELPWRVMSRETGLEDEMLQKMFKRLEGKVYHFDGWVWIKKFLNHQCINPSTKKGIERELSVVPDRIWLKLQENKEVLDSLSQALDSLGIAWRLPKLKLEPKPELKLKPKGRGDFVPPSLQEVENYCRERGNGIDPNHFLDFYVSKGWLIGKNKMKDWKAAVRTWEGRETKQARTDTGVVTLHDGSKARWRGGKWVDANNTNVAIDVGYYPELTKA